MKQRSDLRVALFFLIPNFVGFSVFMLGPVMFSLGASFTNWNLVKSVPFRFVGLENFGTLFQSQDFWLYSINTLYFMLGMPVAIAGSLFLAVLLSQRLRGVVLYRTLFYLPSFTAGVALLILWKALYNPSFGPINELLNVLLEPVRAFADAVSAAALLRERGPFGWIAASGDALPFLAGLAEAQPPEWLASTRNLFALRPNAVGVDAAQWGLGARDAIIFMGVWTAVGGGNMLLYLAGISNIAPELYEAAEIDGAGRWAKFRHVTWPQLAPTTFFIVIMSFIAGLQGGFEQARVMTLGGPAGTTTTLAYYIYIKAFEEFQIGYASAVAWVLFSIVFAITLVNWRFGSRYVNY